MGYNIITISREYGSGGRNIGQLVAEKLGYDFYDNALVDKIAKESGFAEEIIKDAGEYATSGNSFLFSLSMSNLSEINMPSISYQIYAVQKKIITELAEKGRCVIVGRCADYILRERKDTLNVFISASMEFRKNRISDIYHEGGNKPEKMLRDKDKKRKTYYKYYTDNEWGMCHNYNLCLDSSLFGIEKCADIIADIAR